MWIWHLILGFKSCLVYFQHHNRLVEDGDGGWRLVTAQPSWSWFVQGDSSHEELRSGFQVDWHVVLGLWIELPDTDMGCQG